MTIATVKTAMSTVLGTVSGIGNVWKRERNPETEAKFREAFVKDMTLAAAEIHWLRGESEQLGCAVEEDYDTFRIRVYRAWKDDGQQDVGNSSDAFDVTLAGIRTAFSGEQTLDGTAVHCEPIRLLSNGYVEAFGVFCHFAELELRVWTRRSVTYS